EAPNRCPRAFPAANCAASSIRRGSSPNKNVKSRCHCAAELRGPRQRELHKADREPAVGPIPPVRNHQQHPHPSETLDGARLASSRTPDASVASRPRTARPTKTAIATRGKEWSLPK